MNSEDELVMFLKRTPVKEMISLLTNFAREYQNSKIRNNYKELRKEFLKEHGWITDDYEIAKYDFLKENARR